MKKTIAIFLSALMFAPVFATADNAITTFLIGDPCLIPVYTTDFQFPAEGGEIIQVGSQLYFVKTYQSGCENSASAGTVVRTAGQPPTQTPPASTGGGSIINFLTGDPCLVPVYSTDFLFPAEGGKIVQINGSYYFVKTYLAGCENAGSNGTLIRSAGQPPVQTPPPSSGGGSVVNFLIGDPCLVPVYTTDFQFPTEGGKIVQINGSYYFVKTYLAGCENSGSNGTLIRSAGQPPVQTPPSNSGGGSVINFLTGDPCLVPVYNTDFVFPAEGGKIVQIDGSNYFVKTYLAGCENAGANGTLVRSK